MHASVGSWAYCEQGAYPVGGLELRKADGAGCAGGGTTHVDCWDSYLESSHSSPFELGMIVMVCYTNKGPKAMNGGGKRRKVKKKKGGGLPS